MALMVALMLVLAPWGLGSVRASVREPAGSTLFTTKAAPSWLPPLPLPLPLLTLTLVLPLPLTLPLPLLLPLPLVVALAED